MIGRLHVSRLLFLSLSLSLMKLMTSDIFATVRQVYEKVYESVQINGSLEMKASAAAKATSAILISAIDSAESTLRLIKLPASGREGLGFNIMGGKEQGTCILVSRIIPGGIADKQGHLRRGDQLLSINGVSLNDQTHAKAVQLLKQATDGVTILVSYQPKLLQEIEERTDLTRSRRFN